MSTPTPPRRGRRTAVALVVSLALLAVPTVAQAVPVNLATASPFVVLAGSTATNTGPSVLNGALGLAPGTSLVGFGPPAVVIGATHNSNAVAKQAQADLTSAYTVAEEEPVAPGNVLTGTNLGNRTLAPGAYRYASSAQLTGALTLDAEGDPTAQFVFEIGSTLTTASASSVALINGASPCNVFWQVGSSATLGTTTAFQGNLMALTDISLTNGASVIGRLLARNGQVTLINNVIDGSHCGTAPPLPSTPVTTAPGDSTSGQTPTSGQAPTARTTLRGGRNGADKPGRNGTAIVRRAPGEACTAGFSATVRGHLIERVVFSLDGRHIDNGADSPFRVYVRAAPGQHQIEVRVTFKDGTPAKTRTLPYRACAAAVLHPRNGPSQFTG